MQEKDVIMRALSPKLEALKLNRAFLKTLVAEQWAPLQSPENQNIGTKSLSARLPMDETSYATNINITKTFNESVGRMTDSMI